MCDFAEFYVTSNPPLRPNGVKYILDQLKESRIAYVEILYEPTVPWFQCLVVRGQHKPLVNFLTSRLHSILVDETDDYELDLQAGDIEIIGEDPMIISWGAFLQLSQQELEEYEQFRYPEIFRPFAFKSIWQKLRSLDTPPGLNIRRLLEREGDPEWSFKTFMKLSGCQASYNIEQDILYLGSDNKALIDKAQQHLDALFEYRKRSPPAPRHLVLPPATSLDWRISLRPISNFAVATSTIIRTNAVTAKHDYRNLYTNGIIATYVFTERADGVRGPPVATNSNHVQPRKAFVDFVGYIYPPKQPADGPRSRVRVSEHTLPRSVPQDTTAIVADWVRETGESHGQYDQGLQPAASQALDSCILYSTTHRPTEVESSVEPDYHRGARNANPRNLLEDEGPCLSQIQSAGFQGSGAGSSRQEAPRRNTAQGDESSARDGISTHGTGQIINSSSLDFARPNPMPYMNSALADLVGLTIPISKEVQTSNELPEYVAPPKTPEHFTLMTCLQPSSKACGSQLRIRDSGRTTRKANASDLLRMGDEDSLQNLMAPMTPTSGLQTSFRGRSPPREYHRTMGQKVPRRERTGEQRRNDTKERASPSPSPPSSARRKSKIPIRSGTPALRSPGPPRTAAKKGSVTGGEKALAPIQSAGVWNSQLRGGWNKGIGGQQFKELTLPPILRASIEKRLYFEQALEDCLIDMVSRSRILAGKVSMEMVFGRIVLENIDEDVINLGGVDSFEPNYEPLRFLQELAIFDETNLRLHNTLSLDGNDANMLKKIPWISDPKNEWVLQDTEVFYDLNCRDLSTNCCFTVQINAATVAYSFESQRYGLVDVAFIHCPDRSWDLNACLRATDTVYFEEHYGEFANSVTESLDVSDGQTCGNLRFSFHEYGQYRVSVDQVRVRHVARYRDGKHGNTLLNITMWQATNMDLEAGDDGNRSTRHIRVEPSENEDTKGLANVWYEASISSVRLEKVFLENAGMEFGEEIKWAEAQLKEEGVFKSLYRPAICMVEAMDQIGSGNNNGRNPFDGRILPGTQSKIGQLKKGLYW